MIIPYYRVQYYIVSKDEEDHIIAESEVVSIIFDSVFIVIISYLIYCV